MAPPVDSATHCERDAGPENCGIDITACALEEFEEIFSQWQRSFPVCDTLALGATPDLNELARLVLAWSEKVLKSQI